MRVVDQQKGADLEKGPRRRRQPRRRVAKSGFYHQIGGAAASQHRHRRFPILHGQAPPLVFRAVTPGLTARKGQNALWRSALSAKWTEILNGK